MLIKNLSLRQVFDSRGEPTVEAALQTAQGVFSSPVPSGKSRGSREVAVVPYVRARRVWQKIVSPALRGKSFRNIAHFDLYLKRLDGTLQKTKIGGNVMLSLSIAFAKASAAIQRQEIWQVLEREFFPRQKSRRRPAIFSNFINGGAHAHNALEIQEYLVIAWPQKSYAVLISALIEFYRNVGTYLQQKFGMSNLPLGDEAGYAVKFRSNAEPILTLGKLIRKFRLKGKFSLGLDAAASNFYKNGVYFFDKQKLSSAELRRTYLKYFHSCPLLQTIEDPFAENDNEGFRELMSETENKWVIGDDLTTTNPEAIAKSAEETLINAVIIKPNQISTITETCKAIQQAKTAKLKVIVSHRSGETEENFIMHLAKAASADGVKIGAPQRERIAKFNELLRLYN